MKALKKSTLREIKSSLARFIAIFAIVALGVGFFSGLRITKTDMLKTGSGYIADHAMYDFRLVSSLGFTDESAKNAATTAGVRYAEGEISADVLLEADGADAAVSVHSLPKNISTLSLCSGRLPEKAGECVADARRYGENDIGKTLTVVPPADTDTGADSFSVCEFTVVGTANSCNYLNYERGYTTVGSGSVSYFLYTVPESFSSEVYTSLYIKLDSDREIYSDEYKNEIDSRADDMKELCRSLSYSRRAELIDAAVAAAGLSGIPGAEQAAENSIPEADTYVLTRSENTGYVCFENDSAIVEGISGVFPVFFFLVAALVCVTTMSRMVEEQRTQIGTLKALGFSPLSIASKYIFYSGSAASLGALFGYFAGCISIPKIIWKVYGIMYGFSELSLDFSLPLFLISLAVSLLCSAGTAAIACSASLRERPAALIRPKSPKAGKRLLVERLGFIWNHLGFLGKVSVRNIFRYKSRMIMMILGIGGCTALLVTGFGINDSVSNICNYQFDEIMTYDMTVSFSKDMDGDARGDFLSACKDGDDVLFLHSGEITVKGGDASDNATLIIPESSTEGFIDLHDKKRGIDYPDSDVVVLSKALADNIGAAAGDTVTLTDSDGKSADVTVIDLCDNYVYDYIYMSREASEGLFGEKLPVRTAYVRVDGDVHEEAARLGSADGVVTVSVTADLRDNVNKMMSSLNYIILLVSVCAAALAFIVIYNLTNINITERIREIATIKVLGFRRGEVGAYVFRENFALSAVGAIAGLAMGVALHAYVMMCIKVDMVSFETRIAPKSFLISLAMTLFFTAAVNLFMYKKLDGIDMAQSLKSADG